MDQITYEEMIAGLLKGNNALLGHLKTHQAYCQKTLQIKSSQHCTEDMAYDIFIDAVMAFRNNVLKGERPDLRYLRAYLSKICWNMWMAHNRSQERKEKKREAVQEKLYGAEWENMDHLSREEEEREEVQAKQKKLHLIQQAMQKLSEQCRRILQLFIVEGKSMNEIAEMLQMKNANVAKTTKSRCYNRLMKEIHD